MIFKAPRQLPPLAYLLDDQLTRDHAAIARHLGASERTLRRWIADEQAPRAASLALFWETRWGQQIIDAHTFNDARIQAGLAASLRRENAALRARIVYLERVGDFGAANAPSFQRAYL